MITAALLIDVLNAYEFVQGKVLNQSGDSPGKVLVPR